MNSNVNVISRFRIWKGLNARRRDGEKNENKIRLIANDEICFCSNGIDARHDINCLLKNKATAE